MEPITSPLVLDPDRISRDGITSDNDGSKARQLSQALEESCAYAQQMWNDLAAMRIYLYDSLPTDLRSDSPSTGVEDERQWQQWIDAYAAVTSVLCGPHGDSGFGASSARVLAQNRRAGVIGTTDVDNAAGPEPEPEPVPSASEPASDSAPDAAPSSRRDDVTRTLAANPMLPGALGAIVGALVVTRLRRRAGN